MHHWINFKTHSWSELDIWKIIIIQQAGMDFKILLRYDPFKNGGMKEYVPQLPKTYDELMFGNFSYRDGRAYKSLNGKVSGIDVQQSMNAPIAEKDQQLESVVVIGYGAQQKNL